MILRRPCVYLAAIFCRFPPGFSIPLQRRPKGTLFQTSQCSHKSLHPLVGLFFCSPPQYFSPNELYRKGMVCWQMAQPYVSFMKEADAIVCWGRPWKRLEG